MNPGRSQFMQLMDQKGTPASLPLESCTGLSCEVQLRQRNPHELVGGLVDMDIW